MRPFRFPRATILLMLLILASTMFAIEQGRQVSSGDSQFETGWPGLYGLFAFLAVLMCSIGAIGYGVLCALRQSGAQRFPNIRPWAERR
jgi:hypothetical protein